MCCCGSGTQGNTRPRSLATSEAAGPAVTSWSTTGDGGQKGEGGSRAARSRVRRVVSRSRTGHQELMRGQRPQSILTTPGAGPGVSTLYPVKGNLYIIKPFDILRAGAWYLTRQLDFSPITIFFRFNTINTNKIDEEKIDLVSYLLPSFLRCLNSRGRT